MTVTVTLTAPPEPYLETGPLSPTPRTVQRHRVVALGSGFGRLTATKTLKHADIPDALTFLLRIAGRCTAHVHNQTTLWLQVVPTTAAVLTAAGALVTLYVAIIRDRKSAPHRGGHHRTQTDVLDSDDGQRYEIATAAEHFICEGPSAASAADWESRKGWH